MHTKFPLVISPFYTERGVRNYMAQHLHLALPNDPNKGMWNFYELLQVSPIFFEDHLVIILPVPLVDKFLVLNVYKIYKFPILHHILQKAFQSH